MRKIDEIKTWIQENKWPVLDEDDQVVEVDALLEFIESDLPCTHTIATGQYQTSEGWMPFRAYTGYKFKPNEIEFHRFKFCPDCGQQLEVKQ